jgi:uncharacterized membrane protein (UPF0127 family)
MLFVFGCLGSHPMTMRGCRVSLDIIWLNLDGIVRGWLTAPVDEGVSCWLDLGGLSASVLELAAGQCAAHGVIPGSLIRFVTPSV